MKSAPVITIMGPIGSGKTLQAERVSKDLGWTTFSTGQLIREHSRPDVMEHVNSGKPAPTKYVQDLIINKVKSIDSETGIILDGSPRLPQEADRYEREFPDLGRQLNLVIALNVDEPELENRIKDRGRADDHPEAIKSRMDWFERDILPIIKRYERVGIVRYVDGNGTPDEVTDRIKQVIHEANLS